MRNSEIRYFDTVKNIEHKTLRETHDGYQKRFLDGMDAFPAFCNRASLNKAIVRLSSNQCNNPNSFEKAIAVSGSGLKKPNSRYTANSNSNSVSSPLNLGVG